MKVKDLLGHMQSYGTIDTIDVRHRLITIDTLRWPDAAPYKLGNKYGKATLNSFTVKENVLRIDIEDNY